MSKYRTLDELRAAGYKIVPYLKEDASIDWFKLGVAVGELNAIADKYANTWPEWAKMLRTARTMADRVINERLTMIEPTAVRALINRRNNVKMVIDINYSKRILPEDKDKETVTVLADEFRDCLEMCIVQMCEGCRRDDFKECKFYTCYLKLSVPVFDDSGDCCPYQYDDMKAAEAENMGANNVRVG